MVRRRSTFALGGLFVAAALSSACQSADEPTAPFLDRPAASAGSGSFDGIPSSTTCTVPGGNPSAPLVLPPGFTQTIIASEGPGFPTSPT